MLFIYRILINLILIISPIIIIYRLLIGKEDLKRFKEKFCFFSKEKKGRNLIWFHGASVGELYSILPLLEKLQKNNKVSQILVTSNTLSSSKIIQNYKFKKVIHQFFPIDTNFHSKKFIDYWKPSIVFFIDSEIWPNMFLNLNKKKISINLLNGRITYKTFSKWKTFSNFSKNFFNKFDLCLSSSNESQRYLKKLGVKNIKHVGNLKFIENSEESLNKINKKLKSYLKRKKIWIASSTHRGEEILCAKAHLELKNKFKNLITVIIPRHIDRSDEIISEIKYLNLKIVKHSSNTNNLKNTDIYLVDTFGETKKFYNLAPTVFLGGSIINRGGQNPLEAVRSDANIIHGPNIDNFKDIYKLLKKLDIAKKVFTVSDISNSLIFKKNKRASIKIKNIGEKILKNTIKEFNYLINDEFKKT